MVVAAVRGICTNRLSQNYCEGHLRRCAVLGILNLPEVRSGSCAPGDLQQTFPATFFNSLLTLLAGDRLEIPAAGDVLQQLS